MTVPDESRRPEVGEDIDADAAARAAALSTSAEPSVREVEPGVTQIDHDFRGAPGIIASWLVVDGDDVALVEAGPASTTPTLLAGVRAAGVDPASITRILVTHIHLDHSGAAGGLLEHCPRATVHVHPLGARHLVDPSKLLASAGRVYGALMRPLWGDTLPVPADRVRPAVDGETIVVGRRRLRAVETPGHAAHHHAFLDEGSGACFAGDVAGVRLDGVRFVRPPTPPPEFDPEAWRASIGRLRAANPRRLYLTHFGGYDDVAWHLDDLLSRLWYWAGWTGAQLELGAEAEVLTERLRAMDAGPLADAARAAGLAPEEVAAAYESAGNYRMSVNGMARWVAKR